MSLPTGIRPNEELSNYFTSCKSSRDRIVKISIKDEQLCLEKAFPSSNNSSSNGSNWETDYSQLIPKVAISDNDPSFLLVRLDNKDASGASYWMLIYYSPDAASVRQKMIYAGTKAALKNEFGVSYIKEEIHAASKEDVSFDGLQRLRKLKSVPGPMTEVEQELQQVRLRENASVNPVNAPVRQTLKGVAFPVDQDALDRLEQFRLGTINYVQLAVDTLNEAIKLERSDSVSVNQLRQCIPKRAPRYHFYKFKHQYEGDYYDSVVFLYSMPASGCSIKERMLYSSCKGPFLDYIDQMGLKIDRKVEVDPTEDIGEQYLLDELHPKIHLHQPRFAKPKGPPNQRGMRRVVEQKVESS